MPCATRTTPIIHGGMSCATSMASMWWTPLVLKVTGSC